MSTPDPATVALAARILDGYLRPAVGPGQSAPPSPDWSTTCLRVVGDGPANSRQHEIWLSAGRQPGAAVVLGNAVYPTPLEATADLRYVDFETASAMIHSTYRGLQDVAWIVFGDGSAVGVPVRSQTVATRRGTTA